MKTKKAHVCKEVTDTGVCEACNTRLNLTPTPPQAGHTPLSDLIRACDFFLEAVGDVCGIEASRKAFIKAVAKAEDARRLGEGEGTR